MGTESKTMKPKDVIYPSSSSRHATVGVYSAMKSSFPIIFAQKLDGNLKSIAFGKADKIVGDALKNRETVKDTYFKIGLIGKDLVLRVKTQQKGAAGFFKGHDHKDAVLVSNVTPKAAQSAAPTTEIAFATYFALTPGDCPALVAKYFDIGKGFGIKLSIDIEGADKNSGVRARVADLKDEFCKEYHDAALTIVNELESKLSRMAVHNERGLETHAAEAQAKLEAMFAAAKVGKDFETRVIAMVKSDSNLKQHAKEWRIKGACTAVLNSLKMATAVARLVASHGADLSSYKDILSAGFAFYTLIKDFTKKEAEVAKELDEAIDIYQKSANDLLTEIEKAYKDNSVNKNTTLEKLEAKLATAGTAGKLAQSKITAGIRKVTGKSVAEAPEEARKRYLVELGKLVEGLESQFDKLTTATDSFRRSDIQVAVKAWPALMALKTAAADALKNFKAKLAYATAAKKKIEDLGIEVSDSTALDKLKTAVAGLRKLDKGMVIEGASPVASIGSTVYSAYKAVNALASAIKAVA